MTTPVHATDTGTGSDIVSMTGSTPVVFPKPASFGACQSLLEDGLRVISSTDITGRYWALSGGTAPAAPTGEGIVLSAMSQPMAEWKHIDQSGAHQDGVTNLDTTWEPMELDWTLMVVANTHQSARRWHSRWIAGWEPRKQNRVNWWTPELGLWWIDLRAAELTKAKLPMGALRSYEFDWTVRADFPFWTSTPSLSPLMVADGHGVLVDPRKDLPGVHPLTVAPDGWLPVCNRGDQEGWPTHLLQGPGVFKLGDNGGNRAITMPVAAGQLVKIVTLPRLRTVTEVNTGADVYKLLQGRFRTPVAPGAAVRIPISVTGSVAGVTSARTELFPWRRWPE